jgi:hypothetical protein
MVPISLQKVAEVKCANCGQDFTQGVSGGWRRRYRQRCCSDACQKLLEQREHTARRSRTRAWMRRGLVCEHCGTVLVAQRASKRFCSTRCRVAHHRAIREG